MHGQPAIFLLRFRAKSINMIPEAHSPHSIRQACSAGFMLVQAAPQSQRSWLGSLPAGMSQAGLLKLRKAFRQNNTA